MVLVLVSVSFNSLKIVIFLNGSNHSLNFYHLLRIVQDAKNDYSQQDFMVIMQYSNLTINDTNHSEFLSSIRDCAGS